MTENLTYDESNQSSEVIMARSGSRRTSGFMCMYVKLQNPGLTA